jgi:hypothetical protein
MVIEIVSSQAGTKHLADGISPSVSTAIEGLTANRSSSVAAFVCLTVEGLTANRSACLTVFVCMTVEGLAVDRANAIATTIAVHDGLGVCFGFNQPKH